MAFNKTSDNKTNQTSLVINSLTTASNGGQQTSPAPSPPSTGPDSSTIAPNNLPAADLEEAKAKPKFTITLQKEQKLKLVHTSVMNDHAYTASLKEPVVVMPYKKSDAAAANPPAVKPTIVTPPPPKDGTTQPVASSLGEECEKARKSMAATCKQFVHTDVSFEEASNAANKSCTESQAEVAKCVNAGVKGACYFHAIAGSVSATNAEKSEWRKDASQLAYYTCFTSAYQAATKSR